MQEIFKLRILRTEDSYSQETYFTTFDLAIQSLNAAFKKVVPVILTEEGRREEGDIVTRSGHILNWDIKPVSLYDTKTSV